MGIVPISLHLVHCYDHAIGKGTCFLTSYIPCQQVEGLRSLLMYDIQQYFVLLPYPNKYRSICSRIIFATSESTVPSRIPVIFFCFFKCILLMMFHEFFILVHILLDKYFILPALVDDILSTALNHT